MAKSKSFFGLRRGSTKTLTFSVLKGQQITKDRVAQVANPRTESQMTNRIAFAAPGMFYKRAIKRFFKFAFEGKPARQSEYNAFVSANAGKCKLYLTKEQLADPRYPLVAPWTMTQGSLSAPASSGWFSSPSGQTAKAFIGLQADVSDVTSWNDLMEANPELGLQTGDILTFVAIGSTAFFDPEGGSGSSILVGDDQPIWVIKQVIVGSESSVATDLERNGLTYIGSTSPYVSTKAGLALDVTAALGLGATMNPFAENAEYSLGWCVVRSRKVGNSLAVSNTVISLSSMASQVYDFWISDGALSEALISYGASQDAILQGGLAVQ